jgi:hypothetical protein
VCSSDLKNNDGLIAGTNINIKSKNIENIKGSVVAEKDINISTDTLN